VTSTSKLFKFEKKKNFCFFSKKRGQIISKNFQKFFWEEITNPKAQKLDLKKWKIP